MRQSLTWISVSVTLVLGYDAVAADDAPKPLVALRAGAMAVDISPTTFPVRQNGGFLERRVDRVAEPLHARAVVLSSGTERIAIAIVDSCMLPQTVCDDVKERVRSAIGMPRERVLISATHTHSAPGVMNYCLGSRADPAYTESLPPLIAKAIIGAARREEPAEFGFTVVDAPDHTANRRWIRRLGRPDRDPFGKLTVQAMMHPGHENPNYVGPSGPEDSALSILAVRSLSGRPIALLGNYSMHYFGGQGGLSPDFCGRFARLVEARLAPQDDAFVGVLSQGTSGDLWRSDYGQPRPKTDMDTYTSGLVDLALEAHRTLRYSADVALAMAERRVTFPRRVPDASRLAWARSLLPDRATRPANRPEVYAEQAFYMEENPTEEVVLQAVRIGELGLTAIPCEVYALTGLELKARSPLQPTFNIELSNGAAGYIPPPEQHALGGYTTWPARTAGLEVAAEPKIIGHVLELLEEVAGQPRREPSVVHGNYATTILLDQPAAYWRLEEFRDARAADSSPAGQHARIQSRAAYRLPGPESQAFSREQTNACLHLVGGHLEADSLPLAGEYSVEFWFWNGIIGDDRELQATLFHHGADELRIAAAPTPGAGVLAVKASRGKTLFKPRTWNHVVFVRSAATLSVYLNGRAELESFGKSEPHDGAPLIFGGGSAKAPVLEGRVDEVSVFARALTPNEVARHYDSSGFAKAPTPAALPPNEARETGTDNVSPPDPPRSPAETMLATRLRSGFRLELVAAEPLVLDPVAIDWDEDGRLWVAEMADYPMGGPDGKPGGRIRVLEDRDRDGRYDHSTVFASGIGFPNGVFVWRDGVIVTAAPDIVYLADTDNDRQVDRREVLYTGFLPGNQQLRVNGLRWGLDNWIYCASGGHHAGYGAKRKIRSVPTGVEIALGSRDLRIRPAEGRLEPQSGPAQFGRVRDDWGHWFGVQNSRPLWHYVLADHYASRNPHLPAPNPKQQLRGISPPLWPAKAPQKRYHSYEDAKRFTSACGPGIYRDNLLFPSDGQTHAFTCDPFHSLVQHSILTANGVSFDAVADTRSGQRDFFSSTDRWCRPVMARTGPDGALWIVDMYRYMIEHPDWLPAVGKDELRPFYRAGADRGRIYRVLPAGSVARNLPNAADNTSNAWLERLGSSNGIIRDLAQRRFVAKRDVSWVPALEKMGTDDPRPLARLHALAALAGMGELTETTVLASLADSDSRVARHAIRLAEPFATSPVIVAAAARHVDNADADARLQLAQTLGEWRGAPAGQALGKLAVRDGENPWIRAAILSSALHHQEALAAALTPGTDDNLRAFAPELLTLALKTETHEATARLLAPIIEPEPSLLSAWHLDALGGFLETVASVGTSLSKLADEDPRLALLPERVRKLVETAAGFAVDSALDEELRSAAVSLLARTAQREAQDRTILEGLLDATAPGALQLAAVGRLRALGGDPAALLAHWQSYVPTVRAAVFDALLSRSEWTRSFLNAIQTGTILARTVAASQRQRLISLRDKALAELAQTTLPSGGSSARGDVIAAFRPALALNGLESQGRKVFEARCGACHAVAGVGKAIGPDLRALTDRSGEYLLNAILDPNAAVEPRYVGYSALLKSGEVVHGLVTSETGNSLHLQLPDGSERSLLRSSIGLLDSNGKSFMPEGLEADLSLRDMADVLAFLQGE
jgi:putative membrane-bound dehydrogenase-like protein